MSIPQRLVRGLVRFARRRGRRPLRPAPAPRPRMPRGARRVHRPGVATAFAYYATRGGEIWSRDPKTGRVRRLHPYLSGNGYLYVDIGGPLAVHVIIATTFLGPRPTPYHEVCHGPRGPLCNAVSNLSWGTKRQNAATRRPPRHRPPGGRRLTPTRVQEIRRKYRAGARKVDLARQYGVSPHTIHDVVTRVTWRNVP